MISEEEYGFIFATLQEAHDATPDGSVKDNLMRAWAMMLRVANPTPGLADILRARCKESGGQKAWARDHGISAAYVNDVLQGRREISDNFAALLGYERRVVFVRRA